MASSSKQKTTWSKIQRESKLRDKRAEKAARKEARKYAQENPTPTDDLITDDPAAEAELVGPEASTLETSR